MGSNILERRVGPDMTEVRALCIPLKINDGGGMLSTWTNMGPFYIRIFTHLSLYLSVYAFVHFMFWSVDMFVYLCYKDLSHQGPEGLNTGPGSRISRTRWELSRSQSSTTEETQINENLSSFNRKANKKWFLNSPFGGRTTRQIRRE